MKTEASANPLAIELNRFLEKVRTTIDSQGIEIKEEEAIVIAGQLICRLRQDQQLSKTLQELLDNLRFIRR